MSRLLNVFRESAVWRASLWKRCALRLYREREEALGRVAAMESRLAIAEERELAAVEALKNERLEADADWETLCHQVSRAWRFKRAVRGLVRRLLASRAEVSVLAASRTCVLELRPGDRLMLLHPGRISRDAAASLARAFDAWCGPEQHPVAVLEDGVRPIVVRTAEPAEPHSQAR